MATAVGLFGSKERAEEAIRSLRDSGFSEKISIVAKDDRQGGQEDSSDGDMDMDEGNIADGAAWGGTLGGIAGLMAGLGALAIPGIGPIVAAGPLAATLSGAVAGGIGGGLIDLGIPEETGRQLEEGVRQGNVLAVVESESHEQANEAADVLREKGAQSVEVH